MAMTLEQQRALAIAAARARAAGDEISTAEDVGKSLVSGIGTGLTSLAGIPGDLYDLGGLGAKKLVEGITGRKSAVPEDFKAPLEAPSSGEVKQAVEGVTGEFYKPKTTAGEYAETVGEFLPGGASAAPRKMLSGALKYGVAPGLASEAAGQATEGTVVEPYARIAGAVAGGGGAAAADDLLQARGAIRQAPTREALKQSEQAAYGRASAGGAMFDANAVDLIPAQVKQRLNADNVIIDDVLTPAASRALRDVEDQIGGLNFQNRAAPSRTGNPVGVSLDALTSARRRVQSYFDAIPSPSPIDPNAGKADRRALATIMDELDNWINQASDTALIAGDDRAVEAFREGNRLHAQGAKSDSVERAVQKGLSRALRSGTGANEDNAIRQEIGKVLDRSKGLSAEERAALERAANGTRGQNLLRTVGRMSPKFTLNSGAATAGGAAAGFGVGGPVGAAIGAAAPGIIGGSAKGLADATTQRNAALASALMRGGPGVGNLSQKDRRALALLLAGSEPLRVEIQARER